MKVNKDKALIGILASLLAFYAYRYIIAAPIADPSFGSDFRVTYIAAQKFLAQRTPYEDLSLGFIMRFLYTPPSIALWLPFSQHSFPTALCLWNSLNIGVLAATSYFLYKCGQLQKISSFELSALIVAFLLCYPVMQSFWYGQVNVLIALLLVISLLFYTSRPFLAGISVAIATLIKPIVGILALLFFIERNWRALISFIIASIVPTLAILLFSGVGIFQEYYQTLLAIADISSPLTRAMLSIIILSMACYVVSRSKERDINYCLLLTSASVISPIFHWHHLTFIVPFLLLAIYHCLARFGLISVGAITAFTWLPRFMRQLITYEELILVFLWTAIVLASFVYIRRH